MTQLDDPMTNPGAVVEAAGGDYVGVYYGEVYFHPRPGTDCVIKMATEKFDFFNVKIAIDNALADEQHAKP